jgi:succinate dehydrogenase/fumarate reductase-like Fe-S protein
VANHRLKWWHAQFNLGFRSVLHYLKKLLPWTKRYGLERFRQNYVPEGLPGYTPGFRLIAHEPSRCTTCGMCDVVCPILKAGDAFIGPMRLVVSGMRGGPTLFAVEDELRVMAEKSCADCRKCEAACPEHIPIVLLAQEFAKQLDEVRLFPKGE